jgi:5-methyltetrahydropteroyltriglutamate--homocysteine methyltransferase
MLETTIAGSLPKPSWLAEPERLWAPWKITGPELERAKLDATILAIKMQEDAGLDIVGMGSRRGCISSTASWPTWTASALTRGP